MRQRTDTATGAERPSAGAAQGAEENMLANLFLKENETAASPAARGRIGKFSGGLGIALNTLLAAGKIAAGILAGAVSVVADGLNNLTDCGSNVVSIIGFKMSAKPADKEHPFGHQRAESLSALIIAVIVLVVAAELAIQSAETILSPAETQVSLLTAIVLAASVAVKLFMFFFNRALAKEIGSEALKATAADSISDAAATSAVLLSLLISKWAQIELDGWMGIAVAVFIAFSGIGILKETVSNLLGKAADAETIAAIKQKICAAEGVHGVHDLVIHDYGRSKLFATVHVEVDANMPIMAAHDLADALEKQIGKELNIALTVHIDPLVFDDPKVNKFRAEAARVVAAVDPHFAMHDFRVVGGKTHSNLVFDVAVPFDCKLSDAEIERRIRDGISLSDENLDAVVTVERQ